MKTFDYEKLSSCQWDTEILRLVGKLHECKVRHEAFALRNPKESLRLTEYARIQSTESSNRIEGIVTTSARLKQLVQGRTTPRTRSEQEIVGYRDVLNTIYESCDCIPIKPSYILQLHRDLMRPAGLSFGGRFKNVQNYISETHADGTTTTRFMPVAPYETPAAMEALCNAYNHAIAQEMVDPLLLIPLFIIDFLCIHPFNDGNGRMSRLLTLLLLCQNGYHVGKYISLEAQIDKTKGEYYDALQAANTGWHEDANNPLPFLKYSLQILLACYMDLENRITHDSATPHSAYEAVRTYAQSQIGAFRGIDALAACPKAGRSAVLAALKRLTQEGALRKEGAGRATVYMRVDKERPLPNRETQEAIEEGERIARDPNVKGYHDMESLKAALNSDTPSSHSVE